MSVFRNCAAFAALTLALTAQAAAVKTDHVEAELVAESTALAKQFTRHGFDTLDLTGDEPDLHFRGKPLSTYDAILPRIGNSITYFGTAVVRQFEQMDVFTPNTANGISNARDKLRATQILSRHGIDCFGHGGVAHPAVGPHGGPMAAPR